MIAITDYGAGNLQSVKNALDFIGAENKITDKSDEILAADKLILPGVGAFGSAMDSLNESGLAGAVKNAAKTGIPLLGICLGLQLMFEESEESPNVKGLGLFKGKIVKIPDTGLKIPHMGWNSLSITKNSRILKNIGDNPFVYFVHSYYIQPENKSIVSAYTEYGEPLDIAVESGNVFAVQFHPEKSGEAGLNILKNFAEL